MNKYHLALSLQNFPNFPVIVSDFSLLRAMSSYAIYFFDDGRLAPYKGKYLVVPVPL